MIRPLSLTVLFSAVVTLFIPPALTSQSSQCQEGQKVAGHCSGEYELKKTESCLPLTNSLHWPCSQVEQVCVRSYTGTQ